MKHLSLSLLATTLLISFVSLMGIAAAATISIEPVEGSNRLVVKSGGAPADDILIKLAQRYEFDLDLPKQLPQDVAPPKLIKGSLRTVIARLLEQQNYYIVASAQTAGAVRRVVVMGPGKRQIELPQRAQSPADVRRGNWRRPSSNSN